MGLLPAMSDAMGASASQQRSTAREAADVHGPPLVHCRQCAAWVALSTTRTLSTHRTSGGLVSYFRCPAGHVDFCQTLAESPTSNNNNATRRFIANTGDFATEGETDMDAPETGRTLRYSRSFGG
jgi:hypothetical protein